MGKELNRVYTKNDILKQLSDMNAPRDSIVIVHSSLRLVGRVDGGAITLLDALIEYFTAEGGLLCVSTHTWGNLKNEITLDMSDPATCLGAFSDIAAADPRCIRSQNPTHSMAIFGDRARTEEFIRHERSVSSGTDPISCYGKLYREGGYVLLIGVSHNKNTYLHCVEEMIGQTNRLSPEPRDVTVRLKSGEVIRTQIHTHKTDFTSDVSARFPKYETAFRYHGAITDGFIGNAPTQLCDARIMKETMELIFKRADGEDPLENERAIPQKWYV